MDKQLAASIAIVEREDGFLLTLSILASLDILASPASVCSRPVVEAGPEDEGDPETRLCPCLCPAGASDPAPRRANDVS